MKRVRNRNDYGYIFYIDSKLTETVNLFTDEWVDKRVGLKNYMRDNSKKLYDLLVDENGQTKPVGTRLTRRKYAEALDLIAEDPQQFYKSSIPHDIVLSVSRP